MTILEEISKKASKFFESVEKPSEEIKNLYNYLTTSIKNSMNHKESLDTLIKNLEYELNQLRLEVERSVEKETKIKEIEKISKDALKLINSVENASPKTHDLYNNLLRKIPKSMNQVDETLLGYLRKDFDELQQKIEKEIRIKKILSLPHNQLLDVKSKPEPWCEEEEPVRRSFFYTPDDEEEEEEVEEKIDINCNSPPTLRNRWLK